ncbi:MAG TPA: DUF2306 domain-containing protein [Terracidiphilus sp.]|jgi:uncharacterized membrane protein|nr:DUF2306 domain-containing protein [Terracidiphilus sp.]
MNLIQIVRETKSSKLALWSVMFAMGLFVLLYSEIAFLSPSDPSRPHFYAIRWWLVPHLLCGITAMFSGPFQFSTRLRKHNPHLHRTLGKVYVIAVVLGASLAAYMDLTVDIDPNWMVNAGFLSHPLAWGLTALIAYRTAVTRSFNVHRQWMIRSYLITFTSILVRLPNPIRAWREMSNANFAIVLPLLIFLCFIGADIPQNWHEITTRRTA